ncbi:nucleoside hydrolase [uncultured Piscinibacter sp.]|uniref:nucleoside hydrolase n=1 Tax=uncultured Piscinibacter sp. TaxID=1131835 RepID=UPI0026227253|nr:nucleoside hydrolase [uncultured Piscinibacter sp.]
MPTPMLRHDAWYHARLAPRAGRVRVVIDSDAANEIDDPFAIAWALRVPERLQVEAVYATPYSFAHRRPQLRLQQHRQFDPPGIGMERSHAAIVQVFEALGLDPGGRLWRGSTRYLDSLDAPERSEATDHLIATALATPEDEPLYVVAIGCATNVANALLLEPAIAGRIVVVWTSGYPSHAPHPNHSFNLEQDLLASQWLLDSGVPHVYLPGFHVGAQLRLSLPEMERWVKGRGAIGDHLFDLYTHNPLWELLGIDSFEAHSWVIWDLINIAWLIEPDWVASGVVRTPRLRDDKRWQADATRHPMREAHAVQRDAIFRAFFRALPAR